MQRHVDLCWNLGPPNQHPQRKGEDGIGHDIADVCKSSIPRPYNPQGPGNPEMLRLGGNNAFRGRIVNCKENRFNLEKHAWPQLPFPRNARFNPAGMQEGLWSSTHLKSWLTVMLEPRLVGSSHIHRRFNINRPHLMWPRVTRKFRRKDRRGKQETIDQICRRSGANHVAPCPSRTQHGRET